MLISYGPLTHSVVKTVLFRSYLSTVEAQKDEITYPESHSRLQGGGSLLRSLAASGTYSPHSPSTLLAEMLLL